MPQYPRDERCRNEEEVTGAHFCAVIVGGMNGKVW